MRTVITSSIALACLLALTDAVSAQPRRGQGGAPQGSISGTVIDGGTGSPLAGATAAIRSLPDSGLVTGAIVERDGSFSITGLRPGNYYARVSFVGYTTRLIDFSLQPGALRVDLGKIVLALDSTLKEEVSVTAKREFMTVGIDRTSYNTDDLIVSSGGNATDVLRNIPMIEVDSDGNISLRGNQNVAVQINGRPVVMRGEALKAFLKSISSDAVQRIEVVTNPSAKYDPEGMGGIINIVLDQDASIGLSGTVNGSIGSTNTHNAGVSLAYGSGPLNLFGGYSFFYGSPNSLGLRTRENRMPMLSPFVEQRNTNDASHLGHTVNASADYTIGGAHTLSLTGLYSRRGGDGLSSITTSESDSARLPVLRYERDNDNENAGANMDYRLGYKGVFEPQRHELSAEIRLSADDNEQTNSYTQNTLLLDATQGGDSTPVRQRTIEDNRIRNYALQLDYIRQFGDHIRVEAGYEGELDQTGGDFFSESYDNSLGSFRPDASLNYEFDYRRLIHAFYTTYGQEFGNLSAQVGVRLEQAYTTFDLQNSAQSFDNDYFSVYPSANLAFKASDAVQLRASYSRRVQRPWIRALNPFVSYDDPQFRRSGNPHLKPEYTDSYELSANYFTEGTSMTFTPFYRRTTDALRRWEVLDTNGISTFTFVNFDVNETYGVDLVGTLRVGDWLNTFATVSGYRTVTDAGNIENHLGSEGFVWSARANATVSFPYGIDLQGSLFYRAPMVIEGGEMGSWAMTDFALQKKLFDDKGRVGIRVSDPFKTQGFNVWREDSRYYQEYEHTWNSRSVSLTFSYSFGDPQRMPRRDRGQQQGGGPDMMGM